MAAMAAATSPVSVSAPTPLFLYIGFADGGRRPRPADKPGNNDNGGDIGRHRQEFRGDRRVQDGQLLLVKLLLIFRTLILLMSYSRDWSAQQNFVLETQIGKLLASLTCPIKPYKIEFSMRRKEAGRCHGIPLQAIIAGLHVRSTVDWHCAMGRLLAG